MKTLLSLACLALLSCTANSAPVVLADGGKALYTIICPKDAPEPERFAAAELKKYLGQITGATFTVAQKTKGPSIVVGNPQRLPGSVTRPEGEGFIVAQKGETIYLAGGCPRATLYAVYDFLETLGCLWAAPGFSYFRGTESRIPEAKTLKVDLGKERYETTRSKYRRYYAPSPGTTHEEMVAFVDWMPKLRYNVLGFRLQGKDMSWTAQREKLLPELRKRGIIVEDGGHGYDHFLSPLIEDGKLFEAHPEWFGVSKRFGKPENGYRSDQKRVIFCTTNPNAMAYMQRNVVEYLKARPEIEIFDFWPPDQDVWCECDQCTATGGPSDRHALLVNSTVALLKKEFPNLKTECLAYHFYYEPPKNVPLSADVLLDFADYYQNFEYQFYDPRNIPNKKHNDALVKWSKEFKGELSIYSYYRKGFWRSLPNVIVDYMQNDMKYYDSLGIVGVSVYSEASDWFTYGVNHYALGRLAWNPYDDTGRMMKEYCSTVFGPAAPLAEEVYREFEDVVRFACVIHQTTYKTDAQYDAYAARMQHCIDRCQAEQKKYAEGSVTRNHIGLLGLTAEYALRSIGMMRSLAEKERALQKKDADITFDAVTGALTRNHPLTPELRDWINAHNDMGIFIKVSK